MSKNYFNTHEFQEAFSYIYIDPFEAKIRFESYLNKYPNDYSAYPYYATILINIGMVDEAEKVLNWVMNIASNDGKYNSITNNKNGKNKSNYFKYSLIYTKLRLLCYQERYKEAYEMCMDNDVSKLFSVETVRFYCEKKLGLSTSKLREGYSYIYRQMIDYSSDDFVDHVKKHLSDFNEFMDEPNNSVFAVDFPIDKVIEEVRKYIPSDRRLFHGFVDDLYNFRYDNCGKTDNKSTDFFKVVCFHNTSDFITMCPVQIRGSMPHVDLNYLANENDNHEIRRISQIDKFNKKYKRN